MVIALVIISLIRGKGDGSMSGVKKCSGVDWFLFFLLIGIGFLLVGTGAWYLKREGEHKKKIGYKIAPGEVDGSVKVLLTIVLVTFITGFAVGSLGLGAGLLLNPLLMTFGLHPLVASATG